ncbi:MAG: dipeptidase [Acidobacteria bacterium]|nr:dipeptidase [Acidobacteriota bacterium]
MSVLENLQEFLRIPSISTSPDHVADCRRAAEWVRQFLLDAGLAKTFLIDAPGRQPLVYSESLEAPGKPTLLLYGHYDVQPPDPLELWTSPPFEPSIRGDDIFARGACDDKGQTLILLEALKRFGGRLPVNVKVLIEGEEEANGQHLEAYVPEHRQALKADAALICDTEMFAPGLPTLCTGLRGGVFGELHVEGAAQDLHSGVYGGAAPNPLEAIAQIIAALKGVDGVIRIPGFYDEVRAPAEKELAAWKTLPFDEAEYLRREVGSIALSGEAGYSVLERTWARPTLEVHGIVGGFVNQGFKTVIPAKAHAKISCRLVPDQDPERIVALLRAAIEKATPRGIVSRFEVFGMSPACTVDPSHPILRAAAAALAETFGRPAVYMRSGGSIPVVGLFQRELGIPSVLMGFGLPDDNLHAPNEKFHLPNLYKGIEAVEGFLRVLTKGCERDTDSVFRRK